jgi:RNA polymerase sigma-70 factor, ECF subfamily
MSDDVTELLLQWRRGDESALHRLIPIVHQELKRLARQFLQRERAGITLQTTALVNELYLRLVRSSRVQWQDRAHFFAITSQLMRRVLIDEARRRRNQKRGGDATRVSLDEVSVAQRAPEVDLLAVDDALTRLSEVAPRKGRVVELRFFGGLTVEETAIVLGVSTDVVKREWRTAKLWLRRALDPAGDGPHAMESD